MHLQPIVAGQMLGRQRGPKVFVPDLHPLQHRRSSLPDRPDSIPGRSCHAATLSLRPRHTAPTAAWSADNSTPTTRWLPPAAGCPLSPAPSPLPGSTPCCSISLSPIALPPCRGHSTWGHFYCGFMGILSMWFNMKAGELEVSQRDRTWQQT
jgi:hypothetical protein